MSNKKPAHLSSQTLFEMGDALKVQNHQLASIEAEKDAISDGVEHLCQINNETKELSAEAHKAVDELLGTLDADELSQMLDGLAADEATLAHRSESVEIKKTKTILTGNEWDKYMTSVSCYAEANVVDTTDDPFLTMLSQREYDELDKAINDEFARKTSICNKTDLAFLAVAVALHTAKALLYPYLADKAGYGDQIDPKERLDHKDKQIKHETKRAQEDYKNKQLEKGYSEGEWIGFLTNPVPFDTTTGSPDIGVNLEGRYHRLHTLGHDPVLGWIFGTANIMTDTITLDNFATYVVERGSSMVITPQRVPVIQLFSSTLRKAKEHPLNLPAAIVSERIHLKSDVFTKCGLPVPILETFAPELAGKLYKGQYDALCFSRDIKIVGASAAVSLLIDMIIGIVHSLFYNKATDGTIAMYEVRTRKILLIANCIASTSNIILSSVTRNPKGLDIGGLFVTISHLFTDTKFMLNVKREFIENRIYEKIQDELNSIEQNEDKLLEFEYTHIFDGFPSKELLPS